ncbi:MAG: helix-turn-helix domain-containing protein [Candidatus Sulfotelmatobacter sp.]
MSELMTVPEVAALLNVSEETVTRRFAKVKGVIDLGSPETPKKRRYRVLRIPQSVVEKYVLSKGGRVAMPETPSQPVKRGRPSRKPTTARSEDELTRDLAVVANQHGQDARKTLDRIARRARAMTYVPADRWAEMVWVDEDDDG